jgi:hypothetical protein
MRLHSRLSALMLRGMLHEAKYDPFPIPEITPASTCQFCCFKRLGEFIGPPDTRIYFIMAVAQVDGLLRCFCRRGRRVSMH